MKHYVITSEASVISELTDKSFKSSLDDKKALKYNYLGDAWKDAVNVNNILGSPKYKVISVC